MALNSVTIQNLTYTETSLGNLPTITYTNDGVAGLEKSTVSGSPANISVSIQSGVSTANQIKAAVNADFLSKSLVTVTGSSTAAQVSCVNASLSGGTVAAKATLVVGGTLLLTAASTGTSGNSVTFKFTGGATAGSEVVTVSGNDITCQIADGVSTYAQVKTAYDLVSAATSLAVSSSFGPALSGQDSVQVSIGIVPAVFSQEIGVARVSHASTPLSLTGGVAAAAASLTIQGVVIPFGTTGLAGNAYKVTFTTGATAGAEVVTLSGTTLTVQIQNGVSTVTQIRTAINSAAPAGFGTATGTASTTPLTVNALSMSGGSTATPPTYFVDQGIFKTKEQV